ncbi:hypothetical protein H4R34_003771 [Dimargaris verticillata]|uniref:Uncharacterized protein n=1 Tax=Dimargaris verticillata TaxID=2761393 RepID=A0A9W8E7W5_9FUNG|nr:hypothetical protein H4R34_003771 [Dimargaris verticillata]
MKVLLAYAFLQTTIPSYLLAVSATVQNDQASTGAVASPVAPGVASHRRQPTHGHTSFFYTDDGTHSATDAQTDSDHQHQPARRALTRRQLKRHGMYQGERQTPEFSNQQVPFRHTTGFNSNGGYTDDNSGTDFSDVHSGRLLAPKRRILKRRSVDDALASKPTFSNQQGAGFDTDSHTDGNSATDFSYARRGNASLLKRRYLKRRGVYDSLTSKLPVGSGDNHGYTGYSDDSDQGYTTDDYTGLGH